MGDHRKSTELNPEERAVIGVLRQYGVRFETPKDAKDLAHSVLRAVERIRRQMVRQVAPSQCGAPTLDGHPCINQRLPGRPGCHLHPNWRK